MHCAPLFALAALAAITAAQAQTPAPPGPGDTASYIRAKPDHMASVYPRDTVARAFSNEFTSQRRDKVMGSIKGAPGVNCSDRPNVVIYAMIPFKLRPDQTTWIERYAVGCDKPVGRNLMAILDGSGLKLLELVRGGTRTDPFLQRDLSGPVAGIAKARMPEGCQSFIVADTVITQQPPPGGGGWEERWDIAACDHRSSVDIVFTPSPKGGTTWSIKP